MDQNTVVVMIDEELERLRQVRSIFTSLLPEVQTLEPLLKVSAREGRPATAEVAAEVHEPVAADTVPAEKRSTSRRGIRTGPRGPRMRVTAVVPRALDNKVPTAPVVVSPTARVVVAPPPKLPRTSRAVPVDKLDSLLAAAFATMQ